jgi:hypothetical protein
MDNAGVDVCSRFRVVAWMALAACLAGCASDGGGDAGDADEAAMRAEGERVFSTGASPAPEGEAGAGSGDGARAASDGAWSIGLEFFSGAGHESRARQRSGQLSAELGRSDVRVRSRRNGSAVVLGRYEGPEDRSAQRDLEWIHQFRRGRERPYALAFLTPPPPPPPDPGSVPQYNLVNAKRTATGAQALYTLQIAVYEGRDRERAKRAAEQRVLELRRQGEPAYYFHGTTRSMVTLGALGESAFDVRTQRVSGAVRAMQLRHPLNLLNGTEPIPEAGGGSQPSMLMRIPER